MVIVKNGLKGKNPAAKVVYGNKVVEKMTGNTSFPDSGTVVTALGVATAALNTANNDSAGNTETINEKLVKFKVKLLAVVSHVQTVVNEVSDELALEMIASTFLDPKHQGTINISDLSAKQGVEANSVSVRRKAAGKGLIYRFQISTNPALEDSWKDVKLSTRASVIVTNLLSVTQYFFRVAVIKGDVQQDWSDPISITVD